MIQEKNELNTGLMEAMVVSEQAKSIELNDEDLRFIESVVKKEFDEEFYRQHVKIKTNDDALEHFLDIGWKEGVDPCEWFSVNAYLELNPDVQNIQLNPFFHYLDTGRSEKRPIRVSQKMFINSKTKLQHATHIIEKDFDKYFYRENYDIPRDVKAIEHYLENWLESWVTIRTYGFPLQNI